MDFENEIMGWKLARFGEEKAESGIDRLTKGCEVINRHRASECKIWIMVSFLTIPLACSRCIASYILRAQSVRLYNGNSVRRLRTNRRNGNEVWLDIRRVLLSRADNRGDSMHTTFFKWT
jgi:hypothetical protein